MKFINLINNFKILCKGNFARLNFKLFYLIVMFFFSFDESFTNENFNYSFEVIRGKL